MVRRPLSELHYLVIHHSATPQTWTVNDLCTLHKDMGYEDIGYHFLVLADGLHVGRPILYRGAHAITEKEPYQGITMNWSGIGLCIVGDFSHQPPDDKLLNEVAYGVKRITKKYKIPLDRDHVIPHSVVSCTACPGPFTMQALYKKLSI